MFNIGAHGLDLLGRHDVGARTRSHEETVIPRQTAHLFNGVVAVHVDHEVDLGGVAGVDAGHEAVGDTFDLVQSSVTTQNGAGLTGFEPDEH